MNKLTCWRHRRVWIRPGCIGSIEGVSELSLNERQFLENWIGSGRALVGRAINSCDQSGKNFLPLGLMLHVPEMPKKRLNLQVDSIAILKVDEPLSIQTVKGVLPVKMAAKVDKILAELANYPIQIKVFGSAFWSYEGCQNYMTEFSDIDLLITPSPSCNLAELAKILCHLSDVIGLRLDGEFEFSNGQSVNWREFASEATELLVKTDLGPKMMARHQIVEEFHAPQ
jgi:phosphoribosyl-dephospho-CoA transferase